MLQKSIATWVIVDNATFHRGGQIAQYL